MMGLMGTPATPAVLVAPDKFRGTVTAAEAAAAMARGAESLGWSVRQMPLADGGEGLLEALGPRGGTRRTVEVEGPLGRPVVAEWVQAGRVAVVEMAQASGLLLAGGAAGKRYSLPNSKIMIHQPSAGFQGQASDIDIHARDVLETRERLNGILAKHTGQTVERIKQDSDRDNFMSAETARSYGLIDSMLEKRGELPTKA